MAVPQPNWIAGFYTIAAGASQLPQAEAYPMCIAWAIDRTPDAGFMVSDGTSWTSNAGAAGTNGNTVRSGTGTPSSGLGVNGDFYVDVAATRMYGPKTAGVWGSGVSLVGSTPPLGSATPIVAGTGAAGTATNASREDHVHPAQTVPALSSTTPANLGTAAVGSGTTSARSDHVHNLPSGLLTSVYTGTIGETLIVGLSLGVRRYTVSVSGVTTSDRLVVSLTGAPSNGTIQDAYVTGTNTVSVGLLVPALGIGQVIAVPIVLYKVG